MEDTASGLKKKPKGPIHFNIQLNEEQKKAKDTILNNTITVVRGTAGTGKGLLACNIALDMLFRKEVEKIIITRPLVLNGAEEIGILPGGIDMKLAPMTAPIYDNMFRLYNKEKIENCVKEGQIEVIPFAFMRGRNFSNCIVICDEAQNLTMSQLELLLTRICKGSKVIICGDSGQIDLRNKKDSGFDFLKRFEKEVPGFALVTLSANHRHEIVEHILRVYKDFRD